MAIDPDLRRQKESSRYSQTVFTSLENLEISGNVSDF